MQLKKIFVIGSSNTDMVIKTEEFPLPGETILGGDFFMNQGGKGSNQAVAAKRLGGTVSFMGKIGIDIFGQKSLQIMKDEGIYVGSVCVDYEKPSGIALITVNSQGENSIIVAPGANGTLSPSDFDTAIPEMEESDILLLQLEIPLETVIYIAELASNKGKKVVLNPAPAQRLPDALMKNLFMITPNETEAEILTGIHINGEESALLAGTKLKENGIEVVIITMGVAGAFVLSDEFTGMVKAPKVKAIDTTAAGDTFCGALAVALSEEITLKKAVEFACKAASISVTRFGAQSSIPYRKEIL
jgi:ribokinase